MLTVATRTRTRAGHPLSATADGTGRPPPRRGPQARRVHGRRVPGDRRRRLTRGFANRCQRRPDRCPRIGQRRRTPPTPTPAKARPAPAAARAARRGCAATPRFGPSGQRPPTPSRLAGTPPAVAATRYRRARCPGSRSLSHGGNASRGVRRGLLCCPAQTTAVRGSPTLRRSPTTSTPRNHLRDETVRPYADHLFEIPSVSTLFQPLLSTIPLQVFAASVAQARGYDVDKPRNLAKSVTVE